MNSIVKHYVLTVFSSIYLVDYEKINSLISYGEEKPDTSVHIPRTTFFSCKKVFPEHQQILWKNRSIPVFFFKENIKEPFSVEDSYIKFHFDIIGNIFYFLSGWQEYYSSDRDRYGRFPFKSSVQYKLNIAHIPVVNYYLDMLKVACERVWNTQIMFREKYQTPSVMLSHDIDKINTGWLEEGNALLKEKKIISLFQLIMKRIFDKDPWNNLLEIVRIEKQMQVKSVFYILPRKGKYQEVKNADYTIASLTTQLQKIKDLGWKTGLHASFGTSNNEKE
ncbi:MAG: hypothetical protein D6707_13090, partial [Bacteroidetes bacterium]